MKKRILIMLMAAAAMVSCGKIDDSSQVPANGAEAATTEQNSEEDSTAEADSETEGSSDTDNMQMIAFLQEYKDISKDKEFDDLDTLLRDVANFDYEAVADTRDDTIYSYITGEPLPSDNFCSMFQYGKYTLVMWLFNDYDAEGNTIADNALMFGITKDQDQDFKEMIKLRVISTKDDPATDMQVIETSSLKVEDYSKEAINSFLEITDE